MKHNADMRSSLVLLSLAGAVQLAGGLNRQYRQYLLSSRGTSPV